jgi:N-acetylmuramoyl-L-alanine amidase
VKPASTADRASGLLSVGLLLLSAGLHRPGSAAAEAPNGLRAPLADGMEAVLGADHQLFVEAQPRRGEGLLGFSRRLCGSAQVADLLAEANGLPDRLLAGVPYEVPFELLSANLQLATVRALFEDDRAESEGWRHRVLMTGSRGAESLWRVAEWFTGRGENYRAIRESNQLAEDDLAPGQMILIPARLLRPAFRSALPPSSSYHLEYGGDGEGEYAVYRLKPGEALYSAVVVRFTGRVFAEDVNALAQKVAQRSGIRDVRDIPIGFQVKVPFDLLLPEYLPPGHERRQEYEERLLASARFSNPVRATRLQGVTVVLDAGHGGMDVGASISGVWESVHVYDIMLRTKRLLEEATAATVIATTQDGPGYEISEGDRLLRSKDHRVLTTPNYLIQDSRVGVHLRWYLSNSILRQAVERGGDPAKVVFLSIHADSLHPSLRGAMVYIPGADYRSGSYGKSGNVYSARREVRERPRVSYSSRERIESEGLSRDLAAHLLDSFGAQRLLVHPDKPIRGKVIRGRRAYVPAVIRYNAIPAKVLFEVCNLANPQDRELIETARFRQQVAEALVRGILRYYGQAQGAGDSLVAVTGG